MTERTDAILRLISDSPKGLMKDIQIIAVDRINERLDSDPIYDDFEAGYPQPQKSKRRMKPRALGLDKKPKITVYVDILGFSGISGQMRRLKIRVRISDHPSNTMIKGARIKGAETEFFILHDIGDALRIIDADEEIHQWNTPGMSSDAAYRAVKRPLIHGRDARLPGGGRIVARGSRYFISPDKVDFVDGVIEEIEIDVVEIIDKFMRGEPLE